MMDDDQSNVTVTGYVPLYDHTTDVYVNASQSPVCVSYTISESDDLSIAAASGTAYTSSDIDFTVKVSLSVFVTGCLLMRCSG